MYMQYLCIFLRFQRNLSLCYKAVDSKVMTLTSIRTSGRREWRFISIAEPEDETMRPGKPKTANTRGSYVLLGWVCEDGGKQNFKCAKEDSLTPPSPPSLTPVGWREAALLSQAEPEALGMHPTPEQHNWRCVDGGIQPVEGASWSRAQLKPSAPMEVNEHSCTHMRSIAQTATGASPVPYFPFSI